VNDRPIGERFRKCNAQISTESAVMVRIGHGGCIRDGIMTRRMSIVDDEAASPAGRGASRRSRPLLYVVDDDEATLELLCAVAEDAGWEALGFSRLAPLRVALSARSPTLLILDDELPDGRGGDLARELREDRDMRNVPLLVCTGAQPMRVAEIGAWAPVVAKPFDLAQIDRFLATAADRAANERSQRSIGQAG
jgi:CheY-like chemotaxis protein